MPHACDSLGAEFAFWMPENAQTQKLKISVRRANQGVKIFVDLSAVNACNYKKWQVTFKLTKFEETGHF